MVEEKKGPKRKKHRNSKLGCATCKRRRVKCMEDLPACTNCIKHRVHCEYLDYTEAQLDEIRKSKRVQLVEQDNIIENAEQEALPEGKLDHPTELLETLSIDENGHSHQDRMNHLSLNVNLLLGLHHTSKLSIDSRMNESMMVDLVLTPPSGLMTEDLMHGQDLQDVLDHDLHHDHLLQHDIKSDQHMSHGFELHLSSQVLSDSSTPYQGAPILQDASTLNYAPRLGGGVLDVLNFQASAITQNFDNLLANEDRQIIYPVYSIHNAPDGDEMNLRMQPAAGEYDIPTGPFGAARDVFLKGNTSVTPAVHLLRTLPHAMHLGRTFAVPRRSAVNYELLLLQLVGTVNTLISEGRASLDDIRQLYHVWLCYFIYKAFRLPVMFLCLTNLTTNYLITNVFLVNELPRFDALVLSTRFRNMLVVHLIQHYAIVIKKLSLLLNKNGDPEMAASISYILSLMAIYDPEATANSTKCFRDGMFLVLSYTLHLAQKNHVVPPRLIPIHLQLMTNVTRTVYLPAYNLSFLNEYQKMLTRFGAILQELGGSPIHNESTWSFIQQEHSKLAAFCHKTLTTYIPDVDGSLDDISHQERVFFSMFHSWANLQPSRLLMVRSTTDPVEKVLNLMYRLFRKAVFAVMPQVRFFYLRDFDSPLMLDVFVANKDQDVFGELDFPQNLSVCPEAYERVKPELKTIAAYAIRVLTFLGLRLSVLYRNLVYNEQVRRLYPIKNVVEWRNSITDIGQTREEFHARIGLTEYSILSFNHTYITSLHYPQIIDPAEPEARLETPMPPEPDFSGEVDLMSIQPYGLLPLDAMP